MDLSCKMKVTENFLAIAKKFSIDIDISGCAIYNRDMISIGLGGGNAHKTRQIPE